MTDIRHWGQQLATSLQRKFMPGSPAALAERAVVEMLKPKDEIDEALVKKLIADGADADYAHPSREVATSFYIRGVKTLTGAALQADLYDIAIALIEKGANLEKASVFGHNALSHVASRETPEAVIDAVIESYKKKKFTLVDPSQMEDSMTVVVKSNDAVTLRKMAKAGMDVNLANFDNGTPLSCATLKYRAPNELIETLLAYGADPDAEASCDFVPLSPASVVSARELAAMHGYKELLKLFDDAPLLQAVRLEAEACKARQDIQDIARRSITITGTQTITAPRLTFRKSS